MQTEAYRAFIHELTDTLKANLQVLGLVLVGSTANHSHAPDQWSDHDFFVVTTSGIQNQFRSNTTWPPDHETIVLTVRETEHGLKVLYQSGHIIEYAVFDLDEIKLAKVNDYEIVFDRGGVTEVVNQIASTDTTISVSDIQRDKGMFLCLLIVGAGRVARGELISGQVFIRSHALGHLLSALAQTLPAEDKSLLDNLDPYRRFELVFPEIGQQIKQALANHPIQAAIGLLELYGHVFTDTVDAVDTVRSFLNRIIDSQIHSIG